MIHPYQNRLTKYIGELMKAILTEDYESATFYAGNLFLILDIDNNDTEIRDLLLKRLKSYTGNIDGGMA